MSTLMFWNKQNNAANQNNETKNGKRNWLHTPDALLSGHVVYLVKFLGTCPVEQAKGIEVVKDAIRRLQFAQQMKKAETGNNSKIKKVEITVSVDGVAIQEPRTQKILHQFPLHNISYCADEKGVKKFFSFIAKNAPTQNGTTNNTIITPPTTNGHTTEDGHECFVFISSKLASDITLTIGQAFDLAYRRFMNDSGKTSELSKVQTENKQLERTVVAYKQRLKELSDLIPKYDMERMLTRLGVRDIFEVPQENGVSENHVNNINGGSKTLEIENSINNNNDEKLLIETSNKHFAPPVVPPRNLQNQINTTLDAFKPSGQKMDELLLNSDSDSDFDPRADENENTTNGNGNKISNDLFGFEPPKTFGQQLFANNNNNHINNNNLTNGINGNGAPPNSPPPLLAPPPKAAAPRRSVPTGNGVINNNNGSQDLFGSVPFNPNATSIFDATIGSDTYNMSSSSLNDSLNTQFNSSTKSIPTLELNSTVFDDEFRNPFNESGIYEHNDSNISNVLPEIHALANNSNKLDGILKSSISSPALMETKMAPGGGGGGGMSATNISQNKFDNAFGGPITISNLSMSNENTKDTNLTTITTSTTTITKGKEFTMTNPFAKKAENLLGPRATNYDALRNSPDIEAMQMLNSSGGSNSSTASNKKDKTPNYDIFKEAASAAFSELGNSLGSNKNTNEFSNRMAGVNFSAHSSSSFGSNGQSNFNTTKSILVDDFSLESLDPLRK